MNIHKLLDILNPQTKNKFTQYVSRDIKWAFDIDAHFTGYHDKENYTLHYFTRSGGSWRWPKVGEYLLDSDRNVTRIYFYDDNPINMLNELKSSLPESVALEVVRRD